jgi:hypothetical protein
MKGLSKLIKHLDRIAKVNNDDFQYSINIQPYAKGIKLYFVAVEMYDGHTFISKSISTVNLDEFEIDENQLREACEQWNYSYVD